MVMARDKTTHSKCQEGAPMGSQVQFICVCNYLGEHSCWEPFLTGASSSLSLPGQGYLRRSMTLHVSMKWEAISPHIFASIFSPQFIFSLCTFNSWMF